MELTADTFAHEIAEAMQNYDRYVVCIDKPPDECEDSLRRLMEKAINAYVNRGEGLRHGIALDRQVTVILSQVDHSDRPMCGVYFNLSSPYHRQQQQAVPVGKV
jgi:hypothetical protein